MVTNARELIDKARQRAAQTRKKPTPHPDEIVQLQAEANLALALSNVELAEAMKTFTDTAGKNNGALKDALAALTTKVADLAKR
ncbi:hypothetical protein [Streptomyces sp. NPDC047079]|uniref:hypothetical protein n=1 Tax=Streptomyces sp. NPDC047079 TaxID=3154607 RepID=UPI0033FD2A8C